MTDTNAELLELVKSLAARVDSLETEIKSIRMLTNDEVSEDVMVAIAAAVAAYLGHRARKRQATFAQNTAAWQAATRRSQLNHAPIHLR
jgi:methylmalonyl-CoA carboxyltransferase large subunit